MICKVHFRHVDHFWSQHHTLSKLGYTRLYFEIYCTCPSRGCINSYLPLSGGRLFYMPRFNGHRHGILTANIFFKVLALEWKCNNHDAARSMSVKEGQWFRGPKARSLIKMHCSLRYSFYTVWSIVSHCGQMSEKNIKLVTKLKKNTSRTYSFCKWQALDFVKACLWNGLLMINDCMIHLSDMS